MTLTPAERRILDHPQTAYMRLERPTEVELARADLRERFPVGMRVKLSPAGECLLSPLWPDARVAGWSRDGRRVRIHSSRSGTMTLAARLLERRV